MEERHATTNALRLLMPTLLILMLMGGWSCQQKAGGLQLHVSGDWGFKDPPLPSFARLIAKSAKVAQKASHKAAPAVAQAPLPPPVGSPIKSLPQQSATKRSTQALQFATKVSQHYGKGRSFRLLVQTDKPLYRPGEVIWLRAVAIRSKTNQPLAATGHCNYRLLTPKKATWQSARVPAYHGHSHHAFHLSRDVAGGEYEIEIECKREQVKATRKIMVAVYQPPRIKKRLVFLRKGYDSGDTVAATLSVKRAAGQPLANQALEIIARLGGKVVKRWKVHSDAAGEVLLHYKLPQLKGVTEGSLTATLNDGGAIESISRPIPLRNKRLKIGFFPEGGQAIAGHPARIYFAARQPDQSPQDIEGEIKDQTGHTITSVRSFHDGMGRFVYTPKPGSSYALHIRKPLGIQGKYPLPPASQGALALQLVDDFESRKPALQVMVSSRVARQVMVTALQHETLVGQEMYRLRPGSQLLTLPLKHQWRGIVRLTIFDKAQRPLAERLVFRHRGKGLRFQVTTHRKRYQPRETVEVKVKVSTPDGKPLANARLGASVVDDTVLSYADDHAPDWLAQRFLTQQLTGKIHKPNFYFSTKERKALRGLDLIMGTHGWRSFSWKAIKQGEAPRPIANEPDGTYPPFEKIVWTREIVKTKARLNARRKHRASQGKKKHDSNSLDEQKKRFMALIIRQTQHGLPSGSSKAGGIVAAKGFGGDDSDALGGWRGTRVGDALGGGGLGLKGGGAGGGGLSGSGVGLGRISTYGRGGGRGGRGWGRSRLSSRGRSTSSENTSTSSRIGMYGRYGSGSNSLGWGRSRLRGRRRRSVFVRAGTPSVRGGLDRQIIKRIINQNRRRFKYCYERELIKDPQLQGNIRLWFKIEANGRVSTSRISRTTMNNQRVEQCIVRRARVMRFPSPRGGGVVQVNYPLIFRAGQLMYPSYQYRHRQRWVYRRAFPIRFYAKDARSDVTRDDFRETLYWHPHLITDAWGEVRFRFGLNDSITSFRLSLAGVGAGAIGSHHHVIPSTKPFFLAAKIPLEVSGGDAMVLPLTLRNDGVHKLTMKVTIKLDAAFQLKENPLPSAAVILPGQAHTYFYPIRVKARSGRGDITFQASGNGHKDTLQRTIQIQPRGYPRSGIWHVKVAPAKDAHIQIPLPSTFVGMQGAMRLAMSPQEELERGLASILREPHGCFEQTSSSNYPNIMALSYLEKKGSASPNFVQRAHKMLAKGYRRLLQFETKTGGFSLYGHVPGNEAITAYGLLQMRDLQRVHGGVDQVMVERVTKWLLARRDGKGGFRNGSGSGGHFGYAARGIANAYITYALTALGHKGLQLEQDAVIRNALASNDSYILALALQISTRRHGATHPDTRGLQTRLLREQQKEGRFAGKSSIVNSYGKNADIETTALAIQALLGSDAPSAAVQRSIEWLRQSQGYFGGYGATQATIQALQALMAWEEKHPSSSTKGKLDILHNGQPMVRYLIKSKRTQSSRIPGLRKALRPGNNKITFRYQGSSPRRITCGILFTTYQPRANPHASVTINTTLEKNKARMGEIIRLTATLSNQKSKTLSNAIARIAFPGALSLQLWQVKALQKATGAAMVETKAREVILYFATLLPRAKKTIHLDLIARITGNYTSGPSSSYLYYQNDQKHWSAPLKISVIP